MKFLIVDDDKSIVEAVTIGLQFQWQDAEVHSAGDGEQGLSIFFDQSPDVTLLDVNMEMAASRPPKPPPNTTILGFALPICSIWMLPYRRRRYAIGQSTPLSE